jgi:hypothetical protein
MDMDSQGLDGLDRRAVLVGMSSVGALFLAGCGRTPEEPTVFGLSPDKWGALTPLARGEHVWKFLTTPAQGDEKKELDRLRLLSGVQRVVDRAAEKGTVEREVLFKAQDGALMKNYARFIVHFAGRSVNVANPTDARTVEILNDMEAIVRSPEFIAAAEAIAKKKISKISPRYARSSTMGTSFAIEITYK